MEIDFQRGIFGNKSEIIVTCVHILGRVVSFGTLVDRFHDHGGPGIQSRMESLKC